MNNILSVFRIAIEFALKEAMRSGGWIETIADHPRVQHVLMHFMDHEPEITDSEVLENILQEEINKLRRRNYEV